MRPSFLPELSVSPRRRKVSVNAPVCSSRRCILATDMTRHNEILNKFKSILPAFDFNNKEHRDVVRDVQELRLNGKQLGRGGPKTRPVVLPFRS